jgi:caffeoyl-CoA O-methyltransferase
MGKIVHDAIEAYLSSLNRLSDPLLEEIGRAGRAAGLPLVDAETGALLYVLAAATGARRILEIGTAIGYTTIWLGRALPPDGLLISLEIDAGRAATARANLERAGLADRATVMVADAGRAIAKVAGPFDLIFQDGDKRQYEPLLDRLIDRLRPGGLLVTDDVLWRGEIVHRAVDRPGQTPEATRVMAAHNERLAAEPRLATTIVPLGDGVAISVRRPA